MFLCKEKEDKKYTWSEILTVEHLKKWNQEGNTMKKMAKKILLGYMIISCTIGVAGCFNSTNNDRNREVEENIELNQKRTDIETLKKWFPKLEGMESAEWEAEVLGQSDDNSVPGPSSYRACGCAACRRAFRRGSRCRTQCRRC